VKKKRQISKSALLLAVCHNGADFSCFTKDLSTILKKVLDNRMYVLNAFCTTRYLIFYADIFIAKNEIKLSMQESLLNCSV